MNPHHNIEWYKKPVVLLVIAVCLLGLLCAVNQSRDLPSGLGDKWQAVFLTDGQVYFGKLENNNNRYVTLRNVYYLKYADDVKTLSGQNLNLIKLGGEAHGPEGDMFIAKDKILFFENLKPTSTVVQAILKNSK